MSNEAVDLYIVYRFVRQLTTDFEETKAYELGLIDEKGKKLRKPSTREEKKAYTAFDRLIFNIKRLLQRYNLDNKLGTFSTALWLIKENNAESYSEEDMMYEISQIFEELNKAGVETYADLSEQIANATGSAVTGTGDTGVTWVKHKYRVGREEDKRKRMGRFINGTAYLRRVARESAMRNQ